MEKISCYHKNNYQYELSQACITPYKYACEKCETHVLKKFDGSDSGKDYSYDSSSNGDYGSSYGKDYSYDSSSNGDYGSSYSGYYNDDHSYDDDHKYSGSSHTHTYEESYGNGKSSGCDYLAHWVSGLSSKPSSIWSSGGGISFSASAYGASTSESRTTMVVLASVLATLGVVAMFIRRRQRNSSSDDNTLETSFEIMKPEEFLEDSRASTISALKQARNSINSAAKTVVDLTRSNTLRTEDGHTINGGSLDGRSVTFELAPAPKRSPSLKKSSLKPGTSPTHVWSSWVPPKDKAGKSNKNEEEEEA